MKHLLLITLAFCSTIAFSQAQQGEFLIGADGSFDSSVTSTSFDGDSKTYVSSGTLGIKGGYFVINKLALGLDLSTTASLQTNDFNDIELTTTDYNFSPFARYYILENRIKPYFEGTIGIGFGNEKRESNFGEFENKFTDFNLGLGAGVAIFIHKVVSIDLGFNYSFTNRDFRDTDFENKLNNFSLNAGFSLYL